MSIKLSEKHGVNPSLDLCIICHEPKGVALLGRLKDDKEAPRDGVYSMIPCDDCREKYLKEGVLILEADYDGTPTCDLVVIKEEAFKTLTTTAIPESRIARMPKDMFNELFRKDNNNGD